MTSKTFERAITFYRPPGQPVSLPLLTVNLLQSSGSRISLPLLFDTGASSIVFRHDLYTLWGLPSWDSGEPVLVATAGGVVPVTAYRYQATIEFLGVILNCPVLLQQLPPNPLYVGLFGREAVFEHFGFGFWESTHELLVTTSP